MELFAYHEDKEIWTVLYQASHKLQMYLVPRKSFFRCLTQKNKSQSWDEPVRELQHQ